ncbi:hypothetical protein [Campylobacter gracilis]|uniref:Uncharacterized protein n=1 Tax=Campylobacter gracilis RM3268 TaxID=553220 RepID=C8PE98_9BACT|nr:hypothetical protein [Campylobacter gracilis]AKT92823.1 hypothetical protein CGRAC_1382 [Campylobacter gracilis]EEV18971.1 hypothetical protein CAMGR0001_2449 [Campylobacter gracilis RM3268]UEB45007.1 hypothetical protein LK410_08355 [Campylobacter gracilis]SUW78855.1 sensory box protein [Campylobacter gracilis]
MTNAEIAKKLKIAEKTIYNWRKNRKELFEILELGIKIQESQKNIEYVNNTYKELINLYKKLNEKEQEYYITDIKARILKKEIDK